MKTLITFSYTILISCILLSCETDIPDVDITPPTFNIRISGDGFSRDFTQAEDYDSFQLNLNSESEYKIVLSASDQGGLRACGFEWFTGQLELTSELPAGWSISIGESITYITWEGNISNPLTGCLFAGDFTAHAGQYDISTSELRVYADDFGGESGDSNSIYTALNILTGYDFDTEVVPFD